MSEWYEKRLRIKKRALYPMELELQAILCPELSHAFWKGNKPFQLLKHFSRVTLILESSVLHRMQY